MTNQQLVSLLGSSLRQWGIEARCTSVEAPDLAADIELENGNVATVRRDDTTAAKLPIWRLRIGASRPTEAVSLRLALAVLRTELDPGYRPGRLIIGAQSAARLYGDLGP